MPPPAEARVAIDERVLRQVAENLVTNAIKYAAQLRTHPGRAQRRAGLLAADRRRPRPGDSRRQAAQLFKPFTRLHDGNDGISNGLGLSLAKQIIANAGGQLWYEARDGGGALFVIELPEATAARGLTRRSWRAHSRRLSARASACRRAVAAAARAWCACSALGFHAPRTAFDGFAVASPFSARFARRRAAYHSSPAPATAAATSDRIAPHERPGHARAGLHHAQLRAGIQPIARPGEPHA